MNNYIIHLAVQYIKEGKTFNQFLENVMTAFVSEDELRSLWNTAWFSVGMTMKVKEKILNNMEDENDNN